MNNDENEGKEQNCFLPLCFVCFVEFSNEGWRSLKNKIKTIVLMNLTKNQKVLKK